MLTDKQRKLVSIAVVAGSLQWLSGCSGGMESEFLEKLKAEVAGEEERCYDVASFLDLELLARSEGGEQFLAVRSGSVMNFYKEQQDAGRKMLEVLGQAGYVDTNGKPESMKYNFQSYDGYRLTDKGREHIVWGKGVCVGRRVVTEIVEYTEPSDMMGKTFSEVTYRYDLALNDIVSDLNLGEKVKDRLSGEDKAIFVKTNKGWRLK